MEWRGEEIKKLAKENKISLAKLADKIGVSRQTVNGWIKGQIPKGNYLILLCRIFNVSPDIFFSDIDSSITVPAHRTRRQAKITPAVQEDALKLAKEYAVLFRNDVNSSLLPVVRVRNRNSETVRKIANDLRNRSGISQDRPLDYRHTFTLLENLGIKVIFRYFPDQLKAYAFFTQIYGHRVVFVNNRTNVLDLIFPLIHEAVHAIRDEINVTDVFDAEEEKFCDNVANHAQFPDKYVDLVYATIKDLNHKKGVQVNKLKNFGETYGHSLFGIVKLIKSANPAFDLKIGGADSNMKKKYPAIGDVLFRDDNPSVFTTIISDLSPLFINMIRNQIDTLTNRKLAEILGIESALDAKAVKDELMKARNIQY